MIVRTLVLPGSPTPQDVHAVPRCRPEAHLARKSVAAEGSAASLSRMLRISARKTLSGGMSTVALALVLSGCGAAEDELAELLTEEAVEAAR